MFVGGRGPLPENDNLSQVLKQTIFFSKKKKRQKMILCAVIPLLLLLLLFILHVSLEEVIVFCKQVTLTKARNLINIFLILIQQI
jgi:hypothetical protein